MSGGQALRIDLLGPVRVLDGARTVPVPGRPQVVLVALALAGGRRVGADDLVAHCWDERLPQHPRRALQTLVVRLRGLVGTGTVRTVADGYALDTGHAMVDLAEFRNLALRAESEVDSADVLLRQALQLWRGEPLAGVPSDRLRAEAVTRLAEERTAALLRLIDLELARGHVREVLGDLRALTTEQPLREEFWHRLITALHRDGRRTDALAAYEDIRTGLRDELGIDPGPELQRLHLSLLQDDVVSASPAYDAPPPRQLPAETADFVGREADLATLDRLLADGEPVRIGSVTGLAGAGKTTLALHWAHRVADDFPDGQLYVNLRGFDPTEQALSPATVLVRFLDALGAPPERVPAELDAQAAQYRSLLATKRVLMVLDNARDADQVRPLLPGTPGCLVLVTSRDALGGLIAGHGARPVTVGLPSAADASLMLTRRLGAARAAADPEAVEEIVAACARLPLALAVVAARAALHPEFPLRELAAELRAAPATLDAFAGDDITTDVRAVLSWSYRQLDDDAARLFRLLGLHPGPDFTVPVAASLAGVRAASARRLLTALTRTWLLTEHAPGRYHFHDLLRAYAAELVAGELDALTRLFDHYLHTAHAAAGLLAPSRDPIDLPAPAAGCVPEPLAGHQAAMAWFGAERHNLVAALTYAAVTRYDRHAWQLAWTLCPFLDRGGWRHDLTAIHHAGLAAAERLGDPVGTAHAHQGMANACGLQGQYATAREHLAEALPLFRAAGEKPSEADALIAFSWMLQEEERNREALEEAERAYALYRSIEHRPGAAIALTEVAWCEALLGNYERSVTLNEEAYGILEAIGDRHGQADTWQSLGFAHQHLNDTRRARECFHQALDLYRDLEDPDGAADVLTSLGELHHDSGDTDAAYQAWRQALELRERYHHPAAADLSAKLRSAVSAPRHAGADDHRDL